MGLNPTIFPAISWFLTHYSQKIVISSSSSNFFTLTLPYGRTEQLQASIILMFRLTTSKWFLLCFSLADLFSKCLFHSLYSNNKKWICPKQKTCFNMAYYISKSFLSFSSFSNLKITFLLSILFNVHVFSPLQSESLCWCHRVD